MIAFRLKTSKENKCWIVFLKLQSDEEKALLYLNRINLHCQHLWLFSVSSFVALIGQT